MARMYGGSTGRAGAGGVKSQDREAERQTQRWATEQQRFARGQMREHDKLAIAREREHRTQLKRIESEKRATERASLAAYRAQKRVSEATLGRVGKSAMGAVRSVGAIGTGALAIGGGFAVQGAISQQMRETALASSLANQAGKPGLKGQLLRDSQGVRGFTGEETLNAMSAFYTPTGNLDAAMAASQDIGKLALATSTNFDDMAQAAGMAFNVIRDSITDPIKQIEAMNEVLRTLTAQGGLGAVEIRDMATELAGLGAASRVFTGGPTELLKSMGALAQVSVARGGATNAAEATTAVTRFAADLTKKPSQKALAAAGIDIFADAGKTKLKDPTEIIADVFAKTGGDLTKLEDVFNAESKKVFQGFAPLMREGVTNDKGERLTGKDALMFEFNRFAKATVSSADIESRAASRLADPDLQFKEAMKDFNAKIGSELLPVVTKLIPELAKLTPLLVDAAKGFGVLVNALVNSPLTTIGALIAAKVTADVAAAKIGDVLKKAISSSVAGAGPSPALGAAGLGVTLGAMTALTIYASGVTNFHAEQAASEKEGKLLNEARKDPSKAMAALAQLRADAAKEQAPGVVESTLQGLFGTMGAVAKVGVAIPGLGGALGAIGGMASEDSAKNLSQAVGASASDERIKTSAQMEAELLALAVKFGQKATESIQAPNRGNAPTGAPVAP